MRDWKCKLGSWMQQFRIVVRIRKLLPEAATDNISNVPPAFERKSKENNTDLTEPGTLNSFARVAIKNKMIVVYLKQIWMFVILSAKALNAVGLIASSCLTSSHQALKNDLRTCLEKLNALSWQTRGIWQNTLSLSHPLPTAIILLLECRNNR